VTAGGFVAHAASRATSAWARIRRKLDAIGRKYTARMDGFWIILLEMAMALAIAALIVWWTTRK
jgi:hypothetical protein